MSFFLKKLVGGWLMPFPLACTLLALGLLLWRRQIGRLLAAAALLLLLLCAWWPVASLLLAPLETRYPVWSPRSDPARYVVVMGGSHVDSAGLPVTNRLNAASTSRLLEGIAVHRANPGSYLLLSGGGFGGRSNAELMAETAVALGVSPERIRLQAVSRDTEEEVRLLAEMIGDEPFIVVTSASHMPRTMAAFARIGLEPVPAPTYFIDRRGGVGWRMSVDALAASSAAIHEYLGLTWMALRGSD